MSEAYAKYLQSEQWRSVSAERRRIDGGKCVICGSTTNLNVHHTYYPADWYETKPEQLRTLCKECHLLVHRLQEIYDHRENGIEYTKNRFVDWDKSSPYATDMLKHESARLCAIECWKRNLFTTTEVSSFIKPFFQIAFPEGGTRAKWSLNIGYILTYLAFAKDCYITNEKPSFNKDRRKHKAASRTRFK